MGRIGAGQRWLLYNHRVNAQILARARALFANPTFRFIALFGIYLGALSLALPIWMEESPEVMDFLVRFTALVAYWILVPFSNEVSVSDTVVNFGGFGVRIITECTGLFEMVIYAACVLAFPTQWSKRGLGLLIGLPAIYVFNLLRILCLLLAGRYVNSMFEFFHIYFWQATLIVMITSVWLFWIYWIVRDEADPSLPS